MKLLEELASFSKLLNIFFIIITKKLGFVLSELSVVTNTSPKMNSCYKFYFKEFKSEARLNINFFLVIWMSIEHKFQFNEFIIINEIIFEAHTN